MSHHDRPAQKLPARPSLEEIFNDAIHTNNRLFGRNQTQFPAVITSPPHPPFSKFSADDVSDDESDDDDYDDVISLSTIPEVPSVVAGTLSASEYLEVGSKYRRSQPHKKRSKPNRTTTSPVDMNHSAVVTTRTAFYAGDNQQSSAGDLSDLDKRLAQRRRRLMLLLMAVVVVFVVVLAAIIIIVIIVVSRHSSSSAQSSDDAVRYLNLNITTSDDVLMTPSLLLHVRNDCCTMLNDVTRRLPTAANVTECKLLLCNSSQQLVLDATVVNSTSDSLHQLISHLNASTATNHCQPDPASLRIWSRLQDNVMATANCDVVALLSSVTSSLQWVTSSLPELTSSTSGSSKAKTTTSTTTTTTATPTTTTTTATASTSTSSAAASTSTVTMTTQQRQTSSSPSNNNNNTLSTSVNTTANTGPYHWNMTSSVIPITSSTSSSSSRT